MLKHKHRENHRRYLKKILPLATVSRTSGFFAGFDRCGDVFGEGLLYEGVLASVQAPGRFYYSQHEAVLSINTAFLPFWFYLLVFCLN